MQTTDIVTGSTEMHLVDLDSVYEASNILVHREVVGALQQLKMLQLMRDLT